MEAKNTTTPPATTCSLRQEGERCPLPSLTLLKTLLSFPESLWQTLLDISLVRNGSHGSHPATNRAGKVTTDFPFSLTGVSKLFQSRLGQEISYPITTQLHHYSAKVAVDNCK